ncbi:MAG: hypothetical protein B6I24_05700 [Bacteroidetes bacterium 4572_128]|nr:MAG: hypothetical protein B6I24_05700 [Bacteroidetes bacterium 4572_128]
MLNKYFLIVFFSLNFCFFIFSQEKKDNKILINSMTSVAGNPGLILIPNAHFGKDKDITISVNTISSDYAFVRKGYDEYITSVSVNFLPFMQITASLIKNNDKRKTSHYGIGDRSFKLRLKLFSEQRILPDISLGAHDLFSTDTKYSSAVYMVASKNFKSENKDIYWGIHLGYALDTKLNVDKSVEIKEEGYHPYLLGTFYGISLNYKNNINFILEYDSDKINTGVNILFFDRIGVSARMIEMKGFSFGLNYTLSPGNWFRKPKNRRKEKQKISKNIDNFLWKMTKFFRPIENDTLQKDKNKIIFKKKNIKKDIKKDNKKTNNKKPVFYLSKIDSLKKEIKKAKKFNEIAEELKNLDEEFAYLDDTTEIKLDNKNNPNEFDLQNLDEEFAYLDSTEIVEENKKSKNFLSNLIEKNIFYSVKNDKILNLENKEKLESAYYFLVATFFSKKDATDLKKEKQNLKIAYNETRDLYYVLFDKIKDLENIEEEIKKISKKENFKKIWVLEY